MAGLVFALGGATGCGDGRIDDESSGEIEQSIQGGHTDAPDASVVGIGLVDGARRFYRSCSGSLIAPNLVLTAQHCVASTSKLVRCEDAAFGDPVGPESVLVTLDAKMWGAATSWLAVADVEVPPGGPALCGRDLAVVVLAEPLPVPTLWPRLEAPALEDEMYAAVGYGESSDGAGDGGVRRRRDGLEVACVAGGCESDHVVGEEWRGSHGICSGDSGGPALDAHGNVIGVTSRGPRGCDDPIYGGLHQFAPWIASLGRRAAELGLYAAPRWAAGTDDASAVVGCAARTLPSAPRSAAGWMGLACVGLCFRARRQSREKTRPPRRNCPVR
jgi:hypothetical protein